MARASMAVACAALALLLCATSCSRGGSPGASAEAPPPASIPNAPDLSTPVEAVRSYARWIAYAYRVLDSGVATRAFSASHEVRIDSYVQLLKTERLKAIEQRVVSSDYRVVSEEGSRATVAGREDWRYRYIDTRTGAYDGPEAQASYDVTYALVVEPGKGWVVDEVRADPRGEVK